MHIPFCHRICPYCSFYKHTPGETKMGGFVRALLAEAEGAVGNLEKLPTTLYFGGGTPSMLSPTHLRELFAGLYHLFSRETFQEITFEANPATFTSKTADLYAELGVTRVSLGAQSFTEKELAVLGREHSPQQARDSVATLKKNGRLAINLDLMFSVPGQTLADWETSLREAITLEPHHISAYNLTYEEDTPFFEKLQKGLYHDEPGKNEEMFLLADRLLEAAGYLHYETSNYALPGHQSLHNQGYWRGHPYLGLGPSAVSTIGQNRWKNVPDTASYLARIATHRHARFEEEIIDPEAFRLERLALMLRTTEGLPTEFLLPENAATIKTLQTQNLARLENGYLRLTKTGALLVDPIAAELA